MKEPHQTLVFCSKIGENIIPNLSMTPASFEVFKNKMISQTLAYQKMKRKKKTGHLIFSVAIPLFGNTHCRE